MMQIIFKKNTIYSIFALATIFSCYSLTKKTSHNKNLKDLQKYFSTWGYVKDPQKRHSSYPYISGDTFRTICNFIIDETEIPFDPDKVKQGDIIFICPRLLEPFFKYYHPLIQCRYKILTHNEDMGIAGKFSNYLDDEKIIAWFGQNVEEVHPKLIPIPIGIANLYWPHGDVRVFSNVRSQLNNVTKNKLLYMNFNPSTNLTERSKVYEIFNNKSFCFKSPQKDIFSYLKDCTESKFVLSPRGNGLDCHRTWEIFLMGAYPIVKTSACDKMYEDMPVLIINDWNEVTEDFLNTKYEEMKNKKYNHEKIFADYWFNLIKSYKS
ncbi:hypothetical protein M1446_00855 [Candidatus Dependentiae bacterium]|nr:hypothetical protein [Candidatus Dependentiae bacterium]